MLYTLYSSLLEGLLIRIPDQRLGGGPADAAAVKEHPFFAEIDWDALDRKEIEPPFNPDVDGHMDLQHIDTEFTSEPVPGSLMPGAANAPAGVMVSQVTEAFDGFSFRGHTDGTKDVLSP